MSPRVTAIIQAVAVEHGLTAEDLIGPARARPIAFARFKAMAKVRSLHTSPDRHQFSLPQIGVFFGGRDHTTVLLAIRRAERLFGPCKPIYPMGECEDTRI